MGNRESEFGYAATVDPIFISYRRADTAHLADRVFEHLVGLLGPDRVFKDIDSIAPGVDFREAIDQALAQCGTVLVLIGGKWLSDRLDDPDDFVRRELETAHMLKRRIVPVLDAGVDMPRADQLPPELAFLHGKNAQRLPRELFPEAIRRLVRTLGEPLGPWGPAPRVVGRASVIGPIPRSGRTERIRSSSEPYIRDQRAIERLLSDRRFDEAAEAVLALSPRIGPAEAAQVLFRLPGERIGMLIPDARTKMLEPLAEMAGGTKLLMEMVRRAVSDERTTPDLLRRFVNDLPFDVMRAALHVIGRLRPGLEPRADRAVRMFDEMPRLEFDFLMGIGHDPGIGPELCAEILYTISATRRDVADSIVASRARSSPPSFYATMNALAEDRPQECAALLLGVLSEHDETLDRFIQHRNWPNYRAVVGAMVAAEPGRADHILLTSLLAESGDEVRAEWVAAALDEDQDGLARLSLELLENHDSEGGWSDPLDLLMRGRTEEAKNLLRAWVG